LLEASHEQHGRAIALRTLANALRRRGHLARPLVQFQEALAAYEASGDTVGRCLTLRFIGQTHLDRGDEIAARDALGAAEDVARELGDGRLIAQTRYWIGQVELTTGHLDGAHTAFGDVFDLYRDDAGVGHAYASHGLGEVARRRGEFAAAVRHFDIALQLARSGADAVLEGRVWLSIADLHRDRRDGDEQVQALARAVPVFAGCGAAYLEVRALAALGELYTRRGEATAAAAAWRRLTERYVEAQVPEEDRRYHPPAA
jgi:tetratricopeptide (TPR) repeat protein